MHMWLQNSSIQCAIIKKSLVVYHDFSQCRHTKTSECLLAMLKSAANFPYVFYYPFVLIFLVCSNKEIKNRTVSF